MKIFDKAISLFATTVFITIFVTIFTFTSVSSKDYTNTNGTKVSAYIVQSSLRVTTTVNDSTTYTYDIVVEYDFNGKTIKNSTQKKFNTPNIIGTYTDVYIDETGNILQSTFSMKEDFLIPLVFRVAWISIALNIILSSFKRRRKNTLIKRFNTEETNTIPTTSDTINYDDDPFAEFDKKYNNNK